MNPFILLFTIWAVMKVRKSVEIAALDVLLPVLLLAPSIYWLRIPHTPPLTCADAVILPIGIAAIMKRSNLWKFKRADLWVVLFVLAGFYTDIANIGFQTALFNLPSVVCDTFLAYIIGRLLIEGTGLRERFATRMSTLLALVAVISLSEFVGRKNLFLLVSRRFMQSDFDWFNQIRDGFMRVRGPYAGAENAGIVFLLGFFIALWVWYMNKSRRFVGDPVFLKLHRSTWCVIGVGFGLVSTISRGPIMGAIAGYFVARIAMVKNRRLAGVVAIVLLSAGAVVYHQKQDQIAQLDMSDDANSQNEAVSSAYYRTKLFSVYETVADTGGLFGWSATGYPRDAVQDSIDNEYLLMWVTNGKLGLGLFILIAAETLFGVVIAVRRSRQNVDSCLYYCIAGAILALMFVLSTVFITAQGTILFFLIAGWSQSLREQYADSRVAAPASESKFAFRKVFA